MNALSSEYISCLKIHGVPILPPVLTQKTRKEMEYYKILAISTERKIAALKSSKNLNANSASMTCSNTEGEPATEQQKLEWSPEDDKLILISNLTKKTIQTATQPSDNCIFKSSDEIKDFICDNVENNAEFASMVSDITVIDVSTDNINNLPFDTSSNAVANYHIFEDMSILPQGINSTDISLVEETTKGGADEVNEHKGLKNISDSDFIDGKKASEKEPVKMYSNVGEVHSPGSSSIISNTTKRLENSKKISGSLNDISSNYFDSPKLVRQRSYTIEHPSPVLLAHLEVQSLNSGMEVSSISMSESCATLPRLEKKRPSWDLEMAKVKWSSMTTALNKPQYKTEAIPDDKQYFDRIHKQIKYSHKQGLSKTPTKIQQLSRKPICKDLMTSLQNDLPKSNSKTLPKSLTTGLNQIPLRLTPSTHKKSFSKQNTVHKVTEITSDDSQMDTSINAHTIQEMVEKIQTQQVMQMAALLEKQKLEQIILQKSFEEQKNIFMKQLKQMCPSNISQGKEGNKENLDVNKNCDSESDKFMVRCEAVLKKGRIVLHDVKMAKTIDSFKTPENINNAAPVTLKTIFSRPKSIESESNSSETLKLDCIDNGIMTDRTNDTLADLNFTLSSDVAEESCKFETNHNSLSNPMLDVNKIIQLPINNGCESGKPQLDETFLKSQPIANLDLNQNLMKPVRKLYQEHPTLQQRAAATKIVAWCRGYLVRRLLRTARVQATVQTIRDALCCALQLHRDREGIRGADIDLHRRLIQQITAACYSLHDTFVSSSAAERCELIAYDRHRLRLVSARQQTSQPSYEKLLSTTKKLNKTKIDIMSQSHLGVFPSQTGWNVHNSEPMTRSNYGTLSIDDKHHGTTSKKCISGKEIHSRKPWR